MLSRGSGPLRRLPRAAVPLRQFSYSSRWLETKPQPTPGNAFHDPTLPPPSDASTDSSSPPSQSQPDAEASASSSAKPTAVDVAAAQERLRGWSESKAIALRKRADDLTASMLTTFSQLGSHLNKFTGYDEIEALKRRVVEQEARISEAREHARAAKKAHEDAVLQRSNSQREVNELLQRKSSWSDADVVRFTHLVREDHSHEQAEARAKAEAARAEEAVERAFSDLMQSILARYHEEQVWSDKIRSASTYGSLAALGLNVVVFVLAIALVEPWKRRRLAQTFEKKIEELEVENRNMIQGGMKELSQHLETQEQFLSHIAAMAAALPSVETPSTGLSTDDSLEGTPAEGVSTRTSSDQDIVTLAAATAVVAGIAGWVARSWYGS
ncbi:hypothetical protein GLOTRDRAFT_111396 [Gloeophyllum trabeum ATCC 11539]|uniref:Sensitive to high expression protein 9, mitochondrial n=1 Tax=Gloeophyllum trabeum (strain ATCC 11539 / FP-39264 / Madison 617) TaxID=670483 RepID=S7Q5I4_GLOTA|nr:uncharacterized protein GLOTRDRAFT_111396 [Gloeophyllum trabeum ATCC 11539]EPQ54748.1 hypothetical protein GLOTRDRAFT_111396 [Gloeophyllum trabeum ATCC 11539]